MQHHISLDEWLEIMVNAENLLRTRHKGFCYLNDLEIPGMLMRKADVDITWFVNTYYDYDHYN